MTGLLLAATVFGAVLLLGLVFAVAVRVAAWTTGSFSRLVVLVAVAMGLVMFAMAEDSWALLWPGAALGLLVVGSWWFMGHR